MLKETRVRAEDRGRSPNRSRIAAALLLSAYVGLLVWMWVAAQARLAACSRGIGGACAAAIRRIVVPLRR